MFYAAIKVNVETDRGEDKCHPASTPILKPWNGQGPPKVILQKGV